MSELRRTMFAGRYGQIPDNKYATTLDYLSKSLQKSEEVLSRYKEKRNNAAMRGCVETVRGADRRIAILSAYCTEMRTLLRACNGSRGCHRIEEWFDDFRKLVDGLSGMCEAFRSDQLDIQQELIEAELAHRNDGLKEVELEDGTRQDVAEYIVGLCQQYSQVQIHLEGLVYHLDKIYKSPIVCDPQYDPANQSHTVLAR